MKNSMRIGLCLFMATTLGFAAFGGGCGAKQSTLNITAPVGEVVPYVENARLYLEQTLGTDVGSYCGGFGSFVNPQAPVTVEWTCEAENVSRYKVEYTTDSTYKNAQVQMVKGKFADLYNLYKGAEYRLRITAYGQGNKVLSKGETTFTTTDLGPRVMHIDGIHNVRDLGGYTTASGQRTVQGLLFRGGTLTKVEPYPIELTENGASYMREVLKIKTDADLRNQAETGCAVSPIPDAKLCYFNLGGYSDMLNASAKPLFQMLADKNNYPVYLHCTGGADRTGTASFLINALLGVDEKTLIQDYEFTSFSIYGMRNVQRGEYAEMFQQFLEKLKGYEGGNLQQKTENFLLSIGVTSTEIERIKGIMYGEK